VISIQRLFVSGQMRWIGDHEEVVPDGAQGGMVCTWRTSGERSHRMVQQGRSEGRAEEVQTKLRLSRSL